MDEQRIEEIAEKAAKRIIGEAVPHIVAAHGHFDTSVAEAIVDDVIREALSSQAGVCDECGNPLVPSEATWYHRACDEKRDEAFRAAAIRIPHERADDCPLYYDGCNCTTEAVRNVVDELRKVRPMADAYAAVLRHCGIEKDAIGHVKRQEEELRSLREERNIANYIVDQCSPFVSADLGSVTLDDVDAAHIEQLQCWADVHELAESASAELQRLQEVFISARDHLRKRHGCDNFDAFDVEKCEWLTTEHDFEVASPVEEKGVR